ncbi:MAG: hypothetical protein VX354_00130 [Pseudomonadota bacterium]
MRKIKTLMLAACSVVMVATGCAAGGGDAALALETANMAISCCDANAHRLNKMFYEAQKK